MSRRNFVKPSDFIPTHANEAVKQYIEYDESGRMIRVYVADTHAAHGERCMLTTYAYTTPSSNKINKSKESLATWDSAWDI